MQVLRIAHTISLAQIAPVQIVHPELELPPDLGSPFLMPGVKEIVLKSQPSIHFGQAVFLWMGFVVGKAFGGEIPQGG